MALNAFILCRITTIHVHVFFYLNQNSVSVNNSPTFLPLGLVISSLISVAEFDCCKYLLVIKHEMPPKPHAFRTLNL